MSILLVGAFGSMGKRYQAILKYLNKPYYRLEKNYQDISDEYIPEYVSGIIIATPTDTHVEMIRKYLPLKKAILCEKPICKNIDELKTIITEIKESYCPFQMMYQYKHLVPKFALGDSYYDYFRHGNDGLIWDCLQIIGLSRGKVTLRETSPVWDCQINGHRLHQETMDEAYVRSVEEWLQGYPQNLNEIVSAHEKTWEMANANN